MSEDQLSAISLQGGQIGRENVMYNTWLENRQIDATRVEQLSSHAAATYLMDLKPTDAAYVLATAHLTAAAGAFKVLLRKDAPLAMTILARIKREKAQELVEAMGPDAAWLAHLPVAAEAIADLALSTPELGQETCQLDLAARSPQGTRGYFQSFANGIVTWTESTGAQVSHGEFARYFVTLGGSGGRLGFHVTSVQ